MTQESHSNHRGLAIAAASTGLTLAAGITVGALLGFVRTPFGSPAGPIAAISAQSDDALDDAVSAGVPADHEADDAVAANLDDDHESDDGASGADDDEHEGDDETHEGDDGARGDDDDDDDDDRHHHRERHHDAD